MVSPQGIVRRDNGHDVLTMIVITMGGVVKIFDLAPLLFKRATPAFCYEYAIQC
jgi:hypothetical protein